MAKGLNEAIRLIIEERGISEELVLSTIEELMLAAYKKKFGTSENAVVKLDVEEDEILIYSKKIVVEDLDDEILEIELDEAKELLPEAEVGDELLIEIDPKTFDRGAVQSARQKARQSLREIQKDTLYSEFKGKEGELIIGYYQREKNSNIFVDLGKTEGIMPRRYQSPRETYRPNDKIKALIYEVVKATNGLQIVLSRTHADFVRRIFEIEVPEIYDKIVEIHKIVREPGYRTKIAVYSHRHDVDPVGACVGLKGVRIQNIVKELEGERIDIVRFDPDPRTFIQNSLSPAEIDQIVILDEAKKQALAVVAESQLSLAIGKQGLNVRLANRLVDWSIDVKTVEQFSEMDITVENRRAVDALFSDSYEEAVSEYVNISDLPNLPANIVSILSDNGLESIEDLMSKSVGELRALDGMTDELVAILETVISNSFEFEDEVEVTDGPWAGVETESQEEYYSESSQDGATEDAVTEDAVEESEEEEEISDIRDFPGLPEEIGAVLAEKDLLDIVDLVSMGNEELMERAGLESSQIDTIRRVIEENVEIIEEDGEE